MAANDQLHKLINSLTKNEKGYFRKVSNSLGQQENNYLKLFDAIQAQESYDEAALKKKFASQKFVRNFSMAKIYLTDAILRSLRNYYAADDPQKHTGELIDNVRICFEKGLYEMGAVSLRKGKSIAKRHDFFQQYLVLLDYEVVYLNHFQQDTALTILEKQKVLQYLQTNHELATMSGQVLSLSLRYRNSRSPEEEKQIQEILEICRRHDHELQPLLNRHIARETIANCHSFNGQRDLAFKVKQETLLIYEASPDLIAARQNRYLKLLGNVLALAAESQPLAVFNAMYESLPERLNRHSGMNELKKEMEVRFGLTYYLLNDKPAEAAAFGESHRQFIVHAPTLAEGRKLEMSNLICSAYFCSDQPRQSLRWLRLILDHPAIQQKTWMKKSGKLLELLLFYELGKTDLLDSRLHAIYRNKDQVRELLPYEISLHEFLKNVSVLQSNQKRRAFQYFLEELQLYMNDPKQLRMINRTDLPFWVKKNAGEMELVG